MSTTRKGKVAEARVKSILKGMGYTLVSQAKSSGHYRHGRWVQGGAIDLLEGAIDLVHGHPSAPFVLSQVCHVGGESPRRAKLRAIAPLVAQPHRTILLWAWSGEERAFRVFREAEDWLDRGWRMAPGASRWPWDEATKQAELSA